MAARDRVVALDLLRGAAVAGMIVVTSPGDWTAAYAPLHHADWHGWTTTDMIFPAFLFAVGTAQGLSFPTAIARDGYGRRTARRVLALILLGLALESTYTVAIDLGAWFPGHPGFDHMRLPGVLQRIALCYGITAALLAATSRNDNARDLDPRAVAGAIAILLLGYTALLHLVPVPGFGAGRLDPEGNWAAYVDRAVFGVAHLWPLGTATPDGPVVYDPEGLLSTFPAVTNTLFGVLAAWVWRRAPTRATKVSALGGAALLIAGLALDSVVPINKRIWTSSFALTSAGFSMLAFTGCALVARSPAALRLAAPLRVFGGNAILAFSISTLLGHLYGAPLLGSPGQPESPQHWIDAKVLRIIPDPKLASLACALGVLGVIGLALWPLHRRGVHLKL